MRFTVGEIPKNAHHSFQGYEPLREPKKSRFMIIVSAVQVVLWAFFFFCWALLEPEIVDHFIETRLFGNLIVLLLVIPIHEVFHAMIYPLRDHKKIVFGVWPKMGVFYAMYEGKMMRNRWLAVYAMPFILISLVPMILHIYIDIPSWLIVASILNAGFAAGDIAAIVMILNQVPKQAVILQNGWDTYWQSTVNTSMQHAADAAAD